VDSEAETWRKRCVFKCIWISVDRARQKTTSIRSYHRGIWRILLCFQHHFNIISQFLSLATRVGHLLLYTTQLHHASCNIISQDWLFLWPSWVCDKYTHTTWPFKAERAQSEPAKRSMLVFLGQEVRRVWLAAR